MNKSCLSLLLLICSFCAYGRQNLTLTQIDSLAAAAEKMPGDTVKAQLLYSLCGDFFYTAPAKTIGYYNAERDLCIRLGYERGIAYCYLSYATIQLLRENSDSAIICDSAALKMFTALGDQDGAARSILNIGKIHFAHDKIPEALNEFLTSLKMFGNTHNRPLIAECFENLGIVYNLLKNYPQSEKYLDTALKIAVEAGDKDEQSLVLQNLANLRDLQLQPAEALKYNMAALQAAKEAGDKFEMANCYKTFGYAYTNLQRFDEALANLNTAGEMLEELGDKMHLADVYGGIGVIYANEGKFQQATSYYEKALHIAQHVGSLSIMKAAYEMLTATYEMAGDYKQSLAAYKNYVAIRDSIYNAENTRKNLKAALQFEFDKKEMLAQAQQAKKLQQKNLIIYGTLSALVVVMLMGALLIRQGRLKAQHRQMELEQKQLRAQMNPHFIFNCLNSIQHFVVAGEVKNANRYLSGFAQLMRQTLENSKAGAISLRKELEYLSNYLSLEWMLFEDKFTYEISCDPGVDPGRQEVPAMIIQPFIENAIRHGLCFLTTRPGRLKVRFYLSSGYLYCEIDDNGIGREESQKLKQGAALVHESHGMELTRQRLALVSKSYGSEYQIEVTDKKDSAGAPGGTTVTIKFPSDL